MSRLWSAPPARVTRVAVARESLWSLSVPEDAAQRDHLLDRRGRLVLSSYAVYTDSHDARDFDVSVVPVLRTMATSSARCMLALIEHRSSFEAGRVRAALQVAREVGLPSLVEISDGWDRPQLELLAAARPSYIRLAPELIRGVATVPDIFRSLVSLGEFARERSLTLVARNPLDDGEIDAVRASGIGLMQWGSTPFDTAERPPARPASVGLR